jgi:hypothetical protein
MRRRYTLDDPVPHGTAEFIQYLMYDMPDWPRRLYGRRMIRRLAAGCAKCLTEDAARSRRHHIHAAYRRRNR